MEKAQYISFSSGNSPLDCPCNYENIINSSDNTCIKPRLKVYKAWRRHCKSIARIYEIQWRLYALYALSRGLIHVLALEFMIFS